ARRRRHLELLREEAADSYVEPEPTTLERAQEAALARRVVDALVERDRIALLMREEGLDYTEIAEALGLSVGSVGTTLARARRRGGSRHTWRRARRVRRAGRGRGGGARARRAWSVRAPRGRVACCRSARSRRARRAWRAPPICGARPRRARGDRVDGAAAARS